MGERYENPCFFIHPGFIPNLCYYYYFIIIYIYIYIYNILHHTNGLFIDNSLLKINEITYISTCEFMFKMFNDLHPVITNAFFSVTSSSHNTRSINNFSIINFKKELCRRTLIYIGPITWNKLDNILKNISNYKLFRKRMYTNLLSSYSVYL